MLKLSEKLALLRVENFFEITLIVISIFSVNISLFNCKVVSKRPALFPINVITTLFFSFYQINFF